MRRTPLLLATLLTLAACSGGGSEGGVVVRGLLVDAETGRPVSRKTVYVHGFHDPTDEQATLDPGDGSEYRVRLSASPVRLRVYDNSYAYELYETTLEVPAGTLDHEVRLVPTHRVLLRGRLLWRDGDRLRPLSEGGPEVQKAGFTLSDEKGPVQAFGGCTLSDNGTFAVRVPRARLTARTINTSRALETDVLDLSGEKGEEVHRDFVLVPR